MDGKSAVLAVEAAGVVHEDDVSGDWMAQDSFEFHREAGFVCSELGPAVVSGV